MKARYFFLTAFFVALASASAAAQTVALVHDPIRSSTKLAVSQEKRQLFDRTVLPKIRERLADEGCEESIDIAGVARGSFTRKGAAEVAVFYQFCQTGNGLGKGGVAVFEGDRLVASFVSQESGWTGVNELALYLSGGMHQGSGGTGVEIVEVSGRNLKSIGWFQAESFSEDGPTTGYKVSAKRGAAPAFTREKYVQNAAGRWRRVGAAAPFKLGRIDIKFEVVD